MSIRVLLADDQPLVRDGLAAILGAHEDIHVVGTAHDGAQAVAMAAALSPDVVLMDIRMPGVDGLQATREITAAGPDAPRVLILTTFDLDEYVHEALQAGSSGFLLKDAPREQFVEAVRIVFAGDALLAPSVTRRLIERFVDRSAASVDRSGAKALLADLTPRELEILRLLAGGLSNAEIAEQLVLSVKTVKTHVGRVLMKLGLRDRVQAVVLAYRSGLVGGET